MTWKETTSLCVTSSFKTYNEGKDMRYRRWYRITTDRFSNSERRKRKFLGRSGGMLPLEIFRILTSLTPFPWFLSHSDRILASCGWILAIGGLLHQGQFPYSSGYEAMRVQTIFKINLEFFILLKMYLLWKIWPIPVSRSLETGVDPRLTGNTGLYY